MAIKFNSKLSLLLLFISVSLLLLPSHCYIKSEENEEWASGEESSAYPQIEEPRKAYEQCRRECERSAEGSRQEYQCRKICERQYEEQMEQQRSRGGTEENHHHHDPERQYKECQSRCGRQEHGEQRQYCQQKCQREYERQKREQGREHGRGSTNPRKEWEEEEEKKHENPYFFSSQRFDSKYRTQEGHIKVLGRFFKKSELLKGIEDYRLAILEANPNTFVLPHHCDAESVFVVVGGKATVSYIWRNERRSYKLKQGDVMRVPAGSTVYLINRDDNERLYVLKLLQPVNTPGRFKEYFGVGGEENPESFYRTFSNEILEAAFNTPRERLERLFGQRHKGVIIKASKEQIRTLSQQSESTTGRTTEESWLRPFSLLNERPLFSNRFGQYFEASPHDYEQLRDLDVAVGFLNIKKGGMMAPYYNSRSTKLVLVVGGSGKFEMACPHLSAQKGSQGRKEKTRTDVHYQKVSSHLSVGDAFVVPAGHPISIVASQDSDLQLASFGIKGSFNHKYFLAGQNNIWNQVQSEAKELSFKVPAREIEEILRSQEESYFLAGPGQREEGKGHSEASILDFVSF